MNHACTVYRLCQRVSSSGFSTALTSLPLSFLSVDATPRVLSAPQPSRSPLHAPAKDFEAERLKE